MPNPTGHAQTLVAVHPQNTSASKHGLFSDRVLEPAVQEVADAIMALPHTDDIDIIGAREVALLVVRIDALDAEIDRIGLKGPSARLSWLHDYRLRASRRLNEWLASYGATPLARAKWARELAEGQNLAATIQRKRREAEQNGGQA